ncbi:MAG: CHASE2 domain-containing protein [Gammaproteobacteria bacterium]|nr:CHASE2 domain-containing protein [Gammaproteobacteria bacterium]
MKQPFWKTDWFVGLAVSLLIFVMAYPMGSKLLEALEYDAYDLGVKMTQRDHDPNIAVIAIDDGSIEDIGRWPWSREIIAEMVDKLKGAGAKAIGLAIFYSEPQVEAGLTYINRIKDQIGRGDVEGPGVEAINATLLEAEQKLDVDGRLGQSIGDAGNVLDIMQFDMGVPIGNPDEPLPGYVSRFAIPETNVRDESGTGYQPLPTIRAWPPIPVIGNSLAGVGHLLNPLDTDGSVRSDPLIIQYYDRYFPSFSLALAAASLNLGVDDIKVNLGKNVQLGNLLIATDEFLNMRPFFYSDRTDGSSAFDVDSFYDVQVGNISASKYAGKTVIIGFTAAGLGTQLNTPIGPANGTIIPLAHFVSSIVQEDFFVRPTWATYVEFGLFIAMALYLIAMLPKLKAGRAALISLGMFVGLIIVELAVMRSTTMWLQLVTPAALLFIGHMLLTTKRFMVTEFSKQKLDIESSISYKQLALQFQHDGKLDQAFEYFRKCPVDEALLQNVYDLALDFERKRQFSKAHNAYSYIGERNAEFRDVKEKIRRSKALEETVLLGGAGAGGGGTVLLAGGDVKSTLGRYEVEKELGKGAMGIVYLGKDPRINRTVAIKTMALAQEFEPDELNEVKSRFFREAETAGRLTHPNIVSIYDVGEEHDLCYIAMEFLEGHDLARYCKEGNLLPVPIVLGIVFKAAMALDYAHKHNIVHRDIKPANIMFEPDKKAVKLTDFGIARITDSSKTKTGMVLGTPSYMSPEQLSGKKVDGRSDLFSLGVMLYQMLTGKLPFKGDSMATLMYKIANEPHQDLQELRPELAKQRPCLRDVINKALQKDVTLRYQTGEELARDIQNCAKQVGSK